MIGLAQQHDEISSKGKSFVSLKVLRIGWMVTNSRFKQNRGWLLRSF